MTGWIEFGAAYALFLLSHVIPSRPALRARLIGRMGTSGYIVAYSLLSILLLAWLIVAAGRAPYVQLWPYAPWQAWVPALAMAVACLLVAYGAGASNPLSIGGRSAGFDPKHPGIAGVVRHPLLWTLLLWAGAHMLPNGNLAHVLLFGGFAVFALAGMRMVDRRRQRQLGADWDRMAKRTSFWPFAALLSGQWRPRPRIDPLRLAAAAVIYALLLALHPWAIGVSPMPSL